MVNEPTDHAVNLLVSELSEEAEPQRLTIRYLFNEGFRKFLNLEKGWVRTARDMTLRPGKMVRRYINGDRKEYTHPLSYLVLNGLIAFLLLKLFNFQELMAQEPIEFGVELSPVQMKEQATMNEMMFQNLNLVYLALLVPFALYLRLFFRKSGLNLAEMLVFAIFTIAHTGLFGIVTMPLAKALELSPLGYSLMGICIQLIYVAFATITFFGGHIGTLLKSWFAYLFGFLTFGIMAGIGGFVSQAFLSDSIDHIDEWNLIDALEVNHTSKLRELLAAGVDPNMHMQQSPLHFAAEQGKVDAIHHLVSFGADLDALDFYGRTPILVAMHFRQWDAAHALKQHGASAAFKTKEGRTVLTEAVINEQPTFVEWALDSGVDVDAVQKDKRLATALMVAADNNDSLMVERLLAAGADLQIKNFRGQTAFDVADEGPLKQRLNVPPPSANQ